MSVESVRLYVDRPAVAAALDARIRAAKRALGERLVILGHHYQREEVYRHADFHGDSLQLSRAAAHQKAEFIVFCGVHFMAEVADILSRPDQISILPDLNAGCAMADMASIEQVERAWTELRSVLDPDREITPVTYVNSSAALKAFCGDHGGTVCTSSNARKVLEWAFAQRPKALFFPDQHLGRWTGHQLGIPLRDMPVWDPNLPLGGLQPEEIRSARILLWKGHCSVHQMFQPAHIQRWREAHPEGKVIAHPESAFEVCAASDYVGSTDFILKTVKAAAPGSEWLVGTEINLVSRLAEEVRGENKRVEFMSPMVCMCSTMFRIDPEQLAETLEDLVAGKVRNRIEVPPATADSARRALDRMLEVS
ncbi:quinolinate synthase NadA [Acidithiobacillus caldus]|uniref:quinolinate synthase NadA n=1 Tax=Acidithiobacillus caldus TaxID=33059 RepID=UPI001C067941|nr:quinolinate synthase NadA [Acidithiobacillus caldus]MBU2791068.1 quinolinate synthase NadA [Acidithiobacillus caldus]MBU2820632.1 quinolinate synthase NadA [Acidithiobacillus caldus]